MSDIAVELFNKMNYLMAILNDVVSFKLFFTFLLLVLYAIHKSVKVFIKRKKHEYTDN